MPLGPNANLCMRCTALTGAGPDMTPHKYLEETGYQPRGVIHRCMRCLTSWTAGPAGWARADGYFAPRAPVSPAKPEE